MSFLSAKETAQYGAFRTELNYSRTANKVMEAIAGAVELEAEHVVFDLKDIPFHCVSRLKADLMSAGYRVSQHECLDRMGNTYEALRISWNVSDIP